MLPLEMRRNEGGSLFAGRQRERIHQGGGDCGRSNRLRFCRRAATLAARINPRQPLGLGAVPGKKSFRVQCRRRTRLMVDHAVGLSESQQ